MKKIILLILCLPLLCLLLLLLWILTPIYFFEATCELFFEKYRYPAPARIVADCSICLEGITTVKESKLRCGHLFHDTCIMRWLREHNRCPMCRAEI